MGAPSTLDFSDVRILTRIDFVPDRFGANLQDMEFGTILFHNFLKIEDVPRIIFHGDVNDTRTEPV